MLNHPTIDQLRALRLDGMADAFVELQSPTRPAIWRQLNGWLCCSIARRPTEARNGSRAGCAMPSCVTTKPRSRTSIIDHPANSTKLSSSNWRVTGSGKLTQAAT